jgi:hypothetical protein
VYLFHILWLIEERASPSDLLSSNEEFAGEYSQVVDPTHLLVLQIHRPLSQAIPVGIWGLSRGKLYADVFPFLWKRIQCPEIANDFQPSGIELAGCETLHLGPREFATTDA